MGKFQKMSASEQEIMRFIWSEGGPVSSAQLLEYLKSINKAWKPNTVLTFLARLAEKGILSSVRQGRSNEYLPLITENEYKQFEGRSFLASVHGGSLKNFIAALYEANDLSAAEVKELQVWFAQRRDKE